MLETVITVLLFLWIIGSIVHVEGTVLSIILGVAGILFIVRVFQSRRI